MGILAFGINHTTASVDLRGRVAFAPEMVIESLQQALDCLPGGEIALLSTCNRTEIYFHGEASDEQLLSWLANCKGVALEQLHDCYYCYRDQQAVRHIMCVASGLDSLVLGEPQIFGQIKSAYAVGREAGTVATHLNQVFQSAFAAAKRVRSETAIGQNPVSVAYASVSLAEQIFADLKDVHALLIGAGETIELVARHLRDKQVGSITVANRTLSRAQELAADFSAKAILLSDIHDYLPQADIVISSTASQLPVLGKGAVESALKKRRHKPMFMVDIAVPRDIEPEVETLEDVYIYTVDDLQEVIQGNLRARQSAADVAQVIIDQEADGWSRQQRSLAVVDTIRAFRDSVEKIRAEETSKALQSLQRGQDSESVIEALARNLTNKLMHKPTTILKQASEEGRDDTINATQDLFGLDKKR
ncbi:glutamyl-tRNA reductase [Porticoccaceae bacterium]|nr:glutamyl-tRNA reductase [Porticoccaceae bacterium]MDB9949079.1 glutamyl-tRNA reductase [Porticoccaceae bacterium]MDB9970800.1 glutamyl-tRNA reductase [Porticoccaceae bacterium]MDB9992804.1 glutamyl-tRNA reductase [Porticoccaceae bacterium]MDC1453536.1 glutamyl-tRNA reductase [Porticoccaceae bacterium]